MKLPTVLLAACVFTGFGAAQPPAEPAPAPQDRPREMNPEALKQRLERRLAETERVQELIRAALDKMEKGESVGEILRELEPAGRFRGGDGGNRPEGGRRPDFDPEGPPRMRGEGEGWSPMQPGQPLPEAERERVMTFLREHLPLIAEKFQKLNDVDPDGADRMLSRLVPRLREAQRVAQSDPELARLRLQELKAGISVLEAVREIRRLQDMPGETPSADLAAAKNDLREKLVAQSEARMQLQAHEIEALTKRVEGLRQELERKRANRDQSVEDMLRKIVDNREAPPGEHPEPRRKRPD